MPLGRKTNTLVSAEQALHQIGPRRPLHKSTPKDASNGSFMSQKVSITAKALMASAFMQQSRSQGIPDPIQDPCDANQWQASRGYCADGAFPQRIYRTTAVQRGDTDHPDYNETTPYPTCEQIACENNDTRLNSPDYAITSGGERPTIIYNDARMCARNLWDWSLGHTRPYVYSRVLEHARVGSSPVRGTVNNTAIVPTFTPFGGCYFSSDLQLDIDVADRIRIGTNQTLLNEYLASRGINFPTLNQDGSVYGATTAPSTAPTAPPRSTITPSNVVPATGAIASLAACATQHIAPLLTPTPTSVIAAAAPAVNVTLYAITGGAIAAVGAVATAGYVGYLYGKKLAKEEHNHQAHSTMELGHRHID